MGEALLPTVQIESELVDRARKRLAELAAEAVARALPAAGRDRRHQDRNHPHGAAARRDLIVLGSRERHGLAILLNFTEDTILHAAPCDVLAVRLH